MGVRLHTTLASTVALSVLTNEQAAEIYPDGDWTGGSDALVLEDSGNLEAFVLLGSPGSWRGVARDIATAVDRYEYAAEGRRLDLVRRLVAEWRNTGDTGDATSILEDLCNAIDALELPVR